VRRLAAGMTGPNHDDVKIGHLPKS
jgi:hypothetical protein